MEEEKVIESENKYEPPEEISEEEISEEEAEGENEPSKVVVRRGGSWKQTLVIALIVSLAMYLLMGLMGGINLVTRNDFNNNISNIVNDMGKQTEAINAINDKLDNLETKIAELEAEIKALK